MGEPCYSIVRKPKGSEASNEISLKRRIEGDDLDKCRIAIEEVLQNQLDGERFPNNLMMPVINRYQMNRFTSSGAGKDKRIKKLLYILWECLPKRGPDGKFLDKMVMVCGAFDKDLKHPNQFVCGNVLRTLSKTREPEVIRELIHSIEKCLEWTHSYQRKNAALAIAKIYKNFPDLIPTAPKLISEYLMKETDDECKQNALQALLEIAPEEAKSYLHTCNIPDIHCMNTSIQLLFVELIGRVYKRGSSECQSYIAILTSLIKSSSSPSVRYQAASALTRFSRDPEDIKLAACCFIDICAKDSDNNVKLIALDSLTDLRRINGAERVLRNSIMDILCILQTATDLELHERILKLSLDLVSPLNVIGILATLRHELRKMQDTNVLGSAQETVKYRRLLVNTVHKISERFPHAIVESEMIDTLFDLLICNTVGERTSSKLIMLFKVFMSNNASYQGVVVKKIQDCFNIAKDNSSTHRGLIQLLGDFSESKEQIEKSYKVLKESLGELPIVASERRKAADSSGDAQQSGQDEVVVDKKSASTANNDVDQVTKNMSRLVTADGSYAAQSAINFQSASNAGDQHPPLRSYYLKGEFDTASVLCYALLKMAARYQQVCGSKAESDKMIARMMFMIAAILNAGHSSLLDSEGNAILMNNDHTENMILGLNILQHLANEEHKEVANLMKKIVVDDMRSQLDILVKSLEKEKFAFDDSGKGKTRASKFDDRVTISLFAAKDDDLGFESLDSADNADAQQYESPAIASMPDMFSEIPLTGTLDPIYAFCAFDVNQYDIGLKIHLENRTKSKTFENVTIELASRGEGSSSMISRPEPVVLAPRASVCISTNVKVVSAENRRLFGSISYDDVVSDDREQVIMLNDISVNITDYIQPASIGFDDFRDEWRDCEWENKITVKTKLTNLKEYLLHLVAATNTRCVTADRGLSGDCLFLSANLYARSSFGEEALVNVSVEKETPSAVVTGSVNIRSHSQGMAMSLGEKITTAQMATLEGSRGSAHIH